MIGLGITETTSEIGQMAKATIEKHIHKLKKIRYKTTGAAVLFCALPDCSYKINPILALGKRSICWRCGNSFILNEYALRLAKPHCESCHRSKNGEGKPETVTEAHAAEMLSGVSDTPLTLAERLSQTIKQFQQIAVEDDGEI